MRRLFLAFSLIALLSGNVYGATLSQVLKGGIHAITKELRGLGLNYREATEVAYSIAESVSGLAIKGQRPAKGALADIYPAGQVDNVLRALGKSPDAVFNKENVSELANKLAIEAEIRGVLKRDQACGACVSETLREFGITTLIKRVTKKTTLDLLQEISGPASGLDSAISAQVRRLKMTDADQFLSKLRDIDKRRALVALKKMDRTFRGSDKILAKAIKDTNTFNGKTAYHTNRLWTLLTDDMDPQATRRWIDALNSVAQEKPKGNFEKTGRMENLQELLEARAKKGKKLEELDEFKRLNCLGIY